MLHRISEFCTGPRVALLALLATLNMLVLILHAELPMVSALQVAVALQKANPALPPPQHCDPSLLRNADDELGAFDGRRGGYTAMDARTILCAMAANEGRGLQLYLTRHFPIDMLFPFLYGPAIAALYLHVLWSFHWQWRWLYYFAIAPLAAAVLDVAENLIVRNLVVAGPPPNETLVGIASAITMTKYMLVTVSLVVTIILLVSYLVIQSVVRRPAGT